MNKSNMKTSNYLYIAHSGMYGMLHGMHTGGCLDSLTLENAQEVARSEAYDVVTGYDCIMEAIHDDLNERFGYDDTPMNPMKNTLTNWKQPSKKNVNIPFTKLPPKVKHIGMKWKQTMRKLTSF